MTGALASLLYHRYFLWLVFILNIAGTLWGFEWYWDQLVETPWLLRIFVPDCPLHAMLFALYILMLIRDIPADKGWRKFIAWTAVLGCVKYGIWTIVIIGQFLISPGASPDSQDWLLFASHIGMTLQGLAYSARMSSASQYISLAVVWFALNDMSDYGLGTHPYLPLPGQFPLAASLSVALTVLVALWACYLSKEYAGIKKARGLWLRWR